MQKRTALNEDIGELKKEGISRVSKRSLKYFFP